MREIDPTQEEGGFTLVEVLAAVSILGVIMLALTTALILGFRTLDSTPNRVVSSTDAQFVSTYFPPDVQSANAAKTSSINCNGAANPKVQLDSTEDTAVVRVVVYWVRDQGAGDYQLVRSRWDAAGCGGTSTNNVVARNVAGPDAVSAECTSSACTISVTGKAVATDPQYQFNVTGEMRS